LLEKSARGGAILIGALNLGGSIDPLKNAVAMAELAVEKGALTALMQFPQESSCLTSPMTWPQKSTFSSIPTLRMHS